MNAKPRVGLFNPLPTNLFAYEAALVETVDEIGAEPVVLNAAGIEGAPSLGHKATQALAHVQALGVARRRRDLDVVVNLWPAFGYLDLALSSLVGTTPTWTIVHDPVPITSQHGAGSVARRLARLAVGRRHTGVLAHSQGAEDVLRRLDIGPVTRVGHPMETRPAGLNGSKVDRDGSVLVLGQFKPARDLALLERLGRSLAARDRRGVIRGRGWPSIAGWETIEGFIAEEDFDTHLAQAGCLILPYDRYYQSGVALRAMRVGTPVVGRRHDFLEQHWGHDWPGLVDHSASDDVTAWSEAIDRVEQLTRADVAAAYDASRAKVVAEWAGLLLADDHFRSSM